MDNNVNSENKSENNSDEEWKPKKMNNYRLGKCEVCNFMDAKYSCPKCEVKTCQLKCLNIHKKELNCNGIRDRTKFIAKKKMTDTDLMNDYYFLEECTRYVNDRKSDKIKSYTNYARRKNNNLSQEKLKLHTAANERNIKLRFLLTNFTKNKINTTYYDEKLKLIFWRIEWIFINAGNLKYIDKHCCENERISTLLLKYFTFDNENNDLLKNHLQYYRSRGTSRIKVLLKAEGVPNCKKRFFELDLTETLKENLTNKIIIEFPEIYVLFEENISEFDIIDSDEDIETETKLHLSKYNNKEMIKNNDNATSDRVKHENHFKSKRLKSSNLLFTDENLWDASSGSSDNE